MCPSVNVQRPGCRLLQRLAALQVMLHPLPLQNLNILFTAGPLPGTIAFVRTSEPNLGFQQNIATGMSEHEAAPPGLTVWLRRGCWNAASRRRVGGSLDTKQSFHSVEVHITCGSPAALCLKRNSPHHAGPRALQTLSRESGQSLCHR